MYDHGSRLGCKTNGLSRSTLQRALLVAILLTSIRGIKNFTKHNALGGVNCNYLNEWIFGLPLNKSFPRLGLRKISASKHFLRSP